MTETNHLMELNFKSFSFRMPLLKFIQFWRIIVLGLTGMFSFTTLVVGAILKPKHIVIVTSDDQGWIQAGCYGHPFLKTPHLDAMAANGLRFERFYANAPVCSPTRAGILTGRSNNRTGVLEHGYNLNLEEKTFVQALRKAGFATGHFGKWHLNGIRGPGVPILKDDPYHPGKYGFSHWMTSTNFIDYHPLLSEMGRFDQTKGDASEVIVDRALAFIDNALKVQKPSLSVIWYGAPHSPWIASETDRAPFAHLPIAEQHHYGELVAMDRSIGALRGGLRKLGIEDDTLIWFSSDNGGLRKNFGENAVGPLRGGKKELWEGGLRVPCIIEWPAVIKKAVVKTPCSTLDIAPTIIDLLDLPGDSLVAPVDGESVSPIFLGAEMPERRSIPIAMWDKGALIDHEFKFVRDGKSEYLFNLKEDSREQQNLSKSQPKQHAKMRKQLDRFLNSIKDSQAGKDYPNGLNTPRRDVQWRDHPQYADYLDLFTEFLKSSQVP